MIEQFGRNRGLRLAIVLLMVLVLSSLLSACGGGSSQAAEANIGTVAQSATATPEEEVDEGDAAESAAEPSPESTPEPEPVDLAALDIRAEAEMVDAEGNIIGSVEFREVEVDGELGVQIQVEVDGLTEAADSLRALHIRETGQCDGPDFTSAGDIFNPTANRANPDGDAHGFLHPDGPRAGDLPNIQFNGNGSARYRWTSLLTTLAQGERALLDGDGSAILIHTNGDDYRSQPDGNAGPAVACGVIAASDELMALLEQARTDEVVEERTAFVLREVDEPTGEVAAPDAPSIANQHVTKQSAINSENVGGLALAWQFPSADIISHTPLVQDGRVYFADWGGTAYALDEATGEVIWEQVELETPYRPWPWHGFAGTGALGDGLLFEASVEGNAFALDVETGEVVWQTRFVEQENAGHLGDLLYHDGLLYIGVHSLSEALDAGDPEFEPSFRGNVVALDAQTGEIVWRRYMVEEGQTGAAMWSSFALDPELDALYFTTSNNYVGEASETSDAIIALSASTGEFLWTHQTTAHDIWTPVVPIGSDYGYGAGAQLFEAEIDGEMRRLVGAGQKSGIYYALDRETGERMWESFIGHGQVAGGVRGEASIGAGQIYIWSNNSYNDGNPFDFPLTVRAIDATDGDYLWVYDKAQPAAATSAGFLANDVYFVGSLDGLVQAYAAANGEILWSEQVTGAIASSLMVAGDTLYLGTGVPKTFGGDAKPNGVYAFRVE